MILSYFRFSSRLLVGALALLLVGCQTPAQRFLDRAQALGMRAEITTGTQFRHVVLRTARASQPTLHVYLDHDGTPWLGGDPAADPTPRNDLTLRLMALDPSPSVYVGRPCYIGLAGDPGCAPALWTSGRYSDAVVASMAAAVSKIVAADQASRVVWFGYSGGGTLAMLLSPRLPQTLAVVTVAANLDTDAWTDSHGWPRLTDSRNPASEPPPRGIYRRHYVGGRDTTVPADLVKRAALPSDTVVVVPEYDHRCCWEARWPNVLAEVGAELERAAR